MGAKANVLVGDNAQGKTSLIEALFVLSQGRSFRPSKWDHLISHGAQTSRIRAEFEVQNTSHLAHLEIEPLKRILLLNGKKVSRGEMLAKFPVILFSPESLQAIKEGPEARRSLWDELLVGIFPEHAQLLGEYEKVLKTKSRILKDRINGRISPGEARTVLEALQPQFQTRALQLTLARRATIQTVLPQLKTTLRKVMNRNDVDISVDYVISDRRVTDWEAQQIADLMAERALHLVSQEWEAGQVLAGPHKHDISFVYCGNDSRFFCSQGQQRALILSLKLAQALVQSERTGNEALLLLDDVLSELDGERRNFLVKFLSETSAQTLVTTTDLAFCQSLRSPSLVEYQVRGGVFERVDTKFFSEQRLRSGFDQSP